MKQFAPKTMIYVMIILVLLTFCFVGSMVWGKTLRMSQANHDLTAGRIAAARKTYEDLAVDLPESPYVLHNLGLTAYREGKYQTAADYFQKAVKKLSGNGKAMKDLTAKCYYNLGNVQFKLAEAVNTGTNANTAALRPADLYGNALASFRSAIEADRADRDAKYNYELTKLRLDEAQQQKQPNQKQQDQQQKDQKQKNQKQDGQQSNQPNQKQQNRNNQSGQDQNKGQDPKNNRSDGQAQKGQPRGHNNQNQANQGQAGTQKRGMTKQEAQALLNSAENGDQYMAPMIRDNSSVQKDW